MGIDLAVGGNCQHALHKGKVSMVFQTCLSRYYYFSFNICVFPPALCDLRLVLPRHFSSKTLQSPMLFLIPIFISLSLSDQPMAASALGHSQLFIHQWPVWEWENDLSLYTFITPFFSPCLYPQEFSRECFLRQLAH